MLSVDFCKRWNEKPISKKLSQSMVFISPIQKIDAFASENAEKIRLCQYEIGVSLSLSLIFILKKGLKML